MPESLQNTKLSISDENRKKLPEMTADETAFTKKTNSENKTHANDLKKKAVGSAIAVTAAAGVMVNGLFGTPEDIMARDPDHTKPAAVIMMEADVPVDEESSEEQEDKEEKQTWLMAVRAWILGWPLFLRVMIAVPLWTLGWGIITGLSALWGHVLGPFAGIAVHWSLIALALIAVYALSAKAAFPQLPMKKILSKPNLKRIFLGVFISGLMISAVPLFWEEGARYVKIAQLLAGFLILLFAMLRIRKIHKHYDPSLVGA